MLPKSYWLPEYNSGDNDPREDIDVENLPQPKKEASTQVNKDSDADPRLDEADSVDERSTYKKIGTQENSSVQ